MTPAQRAIIEGVARRHGFTIAILQSATQVRRIAHARQEAMYHLRQAGRWSLPQIGSVLNRHHTTVLTGVRRHLARVKAEVTAWEALGGDPPANNPRITSRPGLIPAAARGSIAA